MSDDLPTLDDIDMLSLDKDVSSLDKDNLRLCPAYIFTAPFLKC